jgi:AraC-like DNA-binding protein
MLWSTHRHIDCADATHTHALFELVVCLEGSGQLMLNGQGVAMRAGRVMLIGPGTEHCFEFAPTESAHLKFICFKGEDAALFLSPAHTAILARLTNSVADFDADATAGQSLGAALACVPDVFGLADTQALRVAWGAIGLILALHEVRYQRHASPLSRYGDRIVALQAWLDERLGDAVSLDEAAAEAGLSRSLLTREFRRHTGQSIVAWCNLKRVERAATRLVASNDPITDVALACGFSNLSHFHHLFKAHYGLAPAAFRRMVASRTLEAVT